MNKATPAALAAAALLLTACSHSASSSDRDQAGRTAQASPSDQCAQHVASSLQTMLNSTGGQGDARESILQEFGMSSPEYAALEAVILDAQNTQARQGAQAALAQAQPRIAQACQNAINNDTTEANPPEPDESNDNDCTKTVMKAMDMIWTDPNQTDQVLDTLMHQYGRDSLVFQTFLAVTGSEDVTTARQTRGVAQAALTAHPLAVQGCSGQSSTPTN